MNCKERSLAVYNLLDIAITNTCCQSLYVIYKICKKENDIFSPNFIRKDKQEEFVHRVRNGISQNVSEQRGIKKKALRNGPKISVLV